MAGSQPQRALNSPDRIWLFIILTGIDVLILTCLVMFARLPRRARQDYRELLFILLVAFASEMTGLIGIYVFHLNMNLSQNLLNVLNLPLAILFYRRLMGWPNTIIIWAAVAVSMSFSLTDLFLLQGLHVYNSYTSIMDCVVYTILSVCFFYRLVNSNIESITHLSGIFWINASFLIFYSAIFFLNTMVEYLVQVLNNDMVAAWLIHNCFVCLFYGMLSYGLILVRKEYLKSQTVA